MDKLSQITYRFGLIAIWLSALFWALFGAENFFDYEDPIGSIIMIIGVLSVTFIAHLLWRWVLGQKNSPID